MSGVGAAPHDVVTAPAAWPDDDDVRSRPYRDSPTRPKISDGGRPTRSRPEERRRTRERSTSRETRHLRTRPPRPRSRSRSRTRSRSPARRPRSRSRSLSRSHNPQVPDTPYSDDPKTREGPRGTDFGTGTGTGTGRRRCSDGCWNALEGIEVGGMRVFTAVTCDDGGGGGDSHEGAGAGAEGGGGVGRDHREPVVISISSDEEEENDNNANAAKNDVAVVPLKDCGSSEAGCAASRVEEKPCAAQAQTLTPQLGDLPAPAQQNMQSQPEAVHVPKPQVMEQTPLPPKSLTTEPQSVCQPQTKTEDRKISAKLPEKKTQNDYISPLSASAPAFHPKGLDTSSCPQPPRLSSLHYDILNFVKLLEPLSEEATMRSTLIFKIKTLVTSIWPCSEILVFGSSGSNLFLPTSDIDLCIFTKGQSSYPIGDLVGLLYRSGMCKTIETRPMAKVKVPCSTHYILQRSNSNEPTQGGLGGFACILLLVSYLQRQEELLSNFTKSTAHTGPRTQRDTIEQPDCTNAGPDGVGDDLGKLFIGFLGFYEIFDYIHYGIDVEHGFHTFLKEPESARLLLRDPTDQHNNVSHLTEFKPIQALFSSARKNLMSSSTCLVSPQEPHTNKLRELWPIPDEVHHKREVTVQLVNRMKSVNHKGYMPPPHLNTPPPTWNLPHTIPQYSQWPPGLYIPPAPPVPSLMYPPQFSQYPFHLP
ncbi:hypothetical protein Pelo_8070 [Pelomyxa schiedti]|nr:hypothetical protein Pelo_8070 [Pelomyxa schiedti]